MQISTLTDCHINKILSDNSPHRGIALYEEIENSLLNSVTVDGIVTEHTQLLSRCLPT